MDGGPGARTRDLMAAVLPLAPNEREFIERLNRTGEIAPDLLTGDRVMTSIIRDHPGLRWKALNVRKHHGLAHLGRGMTSHDEAPSGSRCMNAISDAGGRGPGPWSRGTHIS